MLLFASSCSSQEPHWVDDRSGITEFFNPYEIELAFEPPEVSFATLVPLASFQGPDLNLRESDCASAQDRRLRLLRVLRNGVFVAGNQWAELREGVPLVGDSSLRLALVKAMDVTRDIADQQCVETFGLIQSKRLLIAVESGVPIATVQWVLRAVEQAGFAEVSLLVNAERVSEKTTWSNGTASPIVSGAHEVPDYQANSAQGVVLFDGISWDQALERHAQLAAADVGCVAYGWGPEWSGSDLADSSSPLTVGQDGQIPVLALVPLELLVGHAEVSPTRLVTGAACGSWGHLGPTGMRPSVGR